MNKAEFDMLPEYVKTTAPSTLTVFRSVNITYFDGEYHAETCDYLLAEYPKDFKVIGRVVASDVYTDDERIENYINSFRSFPPEYRGKRDWQMLKRMDELRTFDSMTRTLTEAVGKLNANGNFELTGTKTTHLK